MPSKQIHITGKVQGVWFRASTKQKADELGVQGWVRNLPDGSVLAEAHGEEDSINKLIEWCYSGPELAKVHSVTVKSCPDSSYTNFSIIRE